MLINPDSESLLLSSLIRFPQKTGSVCVEQNLGSDVFSSEENVQLYRFLLAAWASGNQISPQVLAFQLKKEGLLSVVGGVERLQVLIGLNPTDQIIGELVHELRDLKFRRLLLSSTKQAHEDLQGGRPTIEIQSELGKVLAGQSNEALVRTPTPQELNLELVSHAENASAVPTGFKAIDEQCGALYLGDCLMVGGGAKAGKSTLASNIAIHVARQKFVVVFTIEMNRIEFWKRIVNAEATISSTYWHPTMPVSEAQQMRAGAAMTRLQSRKITIIDSLDCIERVFQTCRALKAKHGELGAVVIDYLQLFSTPEKTSTRAEAVASISRACKRAAVSLQTLVIGVSQLNDDGKSLESRGIQRDCNMMLNVLVDEHGNRSVVCAFNRNGPMGMVLPLKAELQFNRFTDE